jgi:hypothetical protein
VLVIFDPGGQLKIPNAFKFIERGESNMNIDNLAPGKEKK